MREISLDDIDSVLPPRLTVMNYGDTRTGKTEFAATWPRPLIIGDCAERGYETIKRMDRTKWFEPDRKPIVWAVDNQADVTNMLAKADPLIASGEIWTVVFDAFSFYCDFYLNALVLAQTKNDMRRAYGDLGLHLRNVRVQVHNRGTNVLWNCLAKHPEKDDETGRVLAGGPLIPGQQGDKFAAGVDLLVHSRLEPIKDGATVVGDRHEIRTKLYKSGYPAGHRLGTMSDRLPDPFVGGTYAELITELGYDPDALRAALKNKKHVPTPIVTAKPTASAAPKPPITNVSAPKVVHMPPSGGNKQPVVKTTTK